MVINSLYLNIVKFLTMKEAVIAQKSYQFALHFLN